MHEIENQKAVQILYDWTFTTPYAGDVVTAQRAQRAIGAGDTGQYVAGHAAAGQTQPGAGLQGPTAAQQQGEAPQQQQQQQEQVHPPGDGEAPPAAALPPWRETQQQIDRALLMERDPILFFDEVRRRASFRAAAPLQIQKRERPPQLWRAHLEDRAARLPTPQGSRAAASGPRPQLSSLLLLLLAPRRCLCLRATWTTTA